MIISPPEKPRYFIHVPKTEMKYEVWVNINHIVAVTKGDGGELFVMCSDGSGRINYELTGEDAKKLEELLETISY